MAQKYVQIIFRNDSCENWKQNNPVLDKSELGFALFSDGTWRYKVGDGKTPWNEMSWGDSNLKVVDDEIYYFSEDEGWINTHISVRDGKAVSAENADSADKLKTARTIALSGDVSGETNFDGSANVTINTTIADDSHLHDGRYYTEAEVDTKLSGKSDTGHKHTKSDITDFPTSMTPVSHASTGTEFGVSSADNYGHAKAGTSTPLMDGAASVGTDNGQYARADHRHPVDTSRAAASHMHTKSQITDFPTSMAPTAHTHDASDITQDSEHRMVSDTKISSWDGTYEQSTAYTDKAIADLVGGAPTTLDTLKEIADAMEESKTVTEALDTAIGAKVSQAEFNSHAGNNTIHVNASEKAAWNKKAEKEHKHAKSEITDFPTSMPASDVSAWAKQPNKPSYAYNEITDKPSTYPPSTHTHDASDVNQDSEHRMVSDTQIASWNGTYGQSAAYTDKAISDLVGDFDGVFGEVAAIKNIQTNTNNLANVTTRVTAAETNIEQIITNLATTNSNVSTLSHRCTTAEANIANDRTLIDKNTSDIQKNTSDIATVAITVGQNSTNITKNGADIAANTTAIEANTTAIETNKTAIADNRGLIGSHYELIEQNTQMIGNLVRFTAAATKSYTNVAFMINDAASLRENTIAITAGYNSPGVGGAKYFIQSQASAPPNGIDVIAVGAELSASLIYENDTIDLRTYGVLANSPADIVTAAFKRAFEVLRANNSAPHRLFIPAGRWTLNAKIQVKSAVEIYGAGRYDTVLVIDHTDIGFQVPASATGLNIHDLRFLVTNTTTMSPVISTSSLVNFSLKRCDIICNDPIHRDEHTAILHTPNSDIRYCEYDDVYIQGFYIGVQIPTTFQDNLFLNCRFYQDHNGIVCDNGGTGNIANIIQNCYFITRSTCIRLYGSYWNICGCNFNKESAVTTDVYAIDLLEGSTNGSNNNVLMACSANNLADYFSSAGNNFIVLGSTLGKAITLTTPALSFNSSMTPIGGAIPTKSLYVTPDDQLAYIDRTGVVHIIVQP